MILGVQTGWRTLNIGAGGWITGIDIAPNGVKTIRTDTYGAYRWRPELDAWDQLVTTASMPSGELFIEDTLDDRYGVFEICAAPSNTNIIYMVFNQFCYRSQDGGRNWRKTGLSELAAANPNDDYRMYGRKMAVDPRDPDTVFLGTQRGGLVYTRNGGVTWTTHGDVTGAASDHGILVAFDASSAASGGRTSRILVSSYGTGVYESTDTGVTFSLTTGTPTTHRHLICDHVGTVYLSTNATSTTNVKKYSGGSWSSITLSNNQWHSIAVDPADADHITVADNGGTINQTFDGGSNWTGPYFAGFPVGSGTRVATGDIPWLAWTNESYMSNGDMVYDPSASNKLYFAHGIGVVWTNPPSSYIAFNWNYQSRGIEQLVANWIVVPPGGKPLCFNWDRAIFKVDNPNTFPSVHLPSDEFNAGWHGDYSPSDPNFIVGHCAWLTTYEGGYSTDGGTTWTVFPSQPGTPSRGGAIAVGDPDNIVIQYAGGGAKMYVTADRGTSWTQISISGVSETGETGWGDNFTYNHHALTADKVNVGTFYAYNYLNTSAGGWYCSTADGANGTWSKTSSQSLGSGDLFHIQIQAVPGKAGHVFGTAGQAGGSNPASHVLYRSTDGCENFSDINSNVREVLCFGFGKEAPGGTYPAIYIVGYVSSVFGIWRSTDEGANWTKIGDFPNSHGDWPMCIAGDPNEYGKVYVGYRGSGYKWGYFP
jgi:hypothetical protein